jgi:hypothetical protein
MKGISCCRDLREDMLMVTTAGVTALAIAENPPLNVTCSLTFGSEDT